ncbi:MAG: DUF885 domain-containing protein [Acidimicrobiaceae bacterium]|nr:DUF885 domain-containing protein [Acidimicrobiaceae bacterium]MBT5850169.1 DUF885 domain-containing protein [Acidimicrobiaceae bacterium]
MTNIYDVSDIAVDRFAENDPLLASEAGLAGQDHRWPDLSPDGAAAGRDLAAAIKAEALACPTDDSGATLAQRVLVDDCNAMIESFDAHEHLRDLNNIVSPHQNIRHAFDVMSTDTAESWELIARRLETIHEPVAGYRASLDEGLRRGMAAARRQVETAIAQGEIAAGENSSFLHLTAADVEPALRERLRAGAEHARQVFGELTGYLRSSYLPAAPDDDAAGPERHTRFCRQWLGTDLDLAETYEWGWTEVERLWVDLQDACREIIPGAEPGEVMDLLQTDPGYAANSLDEFLELMTAQQEMARASVVGTHFDIPAELQPVDVKIEAAGGASAPHYVPASEDLSRNGCVWYPVAGKTFFPLFSEITTANHEGYPGHHLQFAAQLAQGEKLSRYQRLVSWNPGSGEGWALYAEQLMDELGLLERPEHRVGLLASQMFRACRVAIDIGIHHRLTIPTNATFRPGEAWTADLAIELLTTRAMSPIDNSTDEVVRYCGWPGQAISYKVGEQAILDLREEAKAQPGFDLKDFHSKVLAPGAVGLDALRDQVRHG